MCSKHCFGQKKEFCELLDVIVEVSKTKEAIYIPKLGLGINKRNSISKEAVARFNTAKWFEH